MHQTVALIEGYNKHLAFLLLIKLVKVVNKNWSKDLEHTRHVGDTPKMRNKEIHKETTTEQDKNRWRIDSELALHTTDI